MRTIENNLLRLVVLALPLVVAGCADNPITTPGGDPIVLPGRLTTGGSDEFSLLLEDQGTIRVTMTDITPVLISIPPGTEPVISLGVGIGDDETGDCVLSFGANLFEGDELTVLLTDTARCILVFDNGTLPEDAVVDYIVTVTDE